MEVRFLLFFCYCRHHPTPSFKPSQCGGRWNSHIFPYFNNPLISYGSRFFLWVCFSFILPERQTNKVKKAGKGKKKERSTYVAKIGNSSHLLPRWSSPLVTTMASRAEQGVGVCAYALSAYMEGKYFYANVMILCSIHTYWRFFFLPSTSWRTNATQPASVVWPVREKMIISSFPRHALVDTTGRKKKKTGIKYNFPEYILYLFKFLG